MQKYGFSFFSPLSSRHYLGSCRPWRECDGGAKRFQAGWHIRVGFDYRALHFGVDYGTDFNDILSASKIKTASITLGWNF